MDLQPIPQRDNLVSVVTTQLAQTIRSGAFAPGARLPAENDLARQLGVSRTVIREALALLKADHLVVTQRGQGLFVSETALGQGVLRFKPPNGGAVAVIRELFELRTGLETEAARLAAARRSSLDIAELTEILGKLDLAAAGTADGVDEDLCFHQLIARISKNSFIVQVLDFLSDSLRSSITKSREIDAARVDYLASVRIEHHRILDAITAGDTVAAGEAMRAHLDSGLRRLLMNEAPPT